jgi:hypothetical protein
MNEERDCCGLFGYQKVLKVSHDAEGVDIAQLYLRDERSSFFALHLFFLQYVVFVPQKCFDF